VSFNIDGGGVSLSPQEFCRQLLRHEADSDGMDIAVSRIS